MNVILVCYLKQLKKHGKEKFMIEVIEQFNNITQKELDAAEIKYIKQYLPDAERFIFTTPEDISFCRYGMEGLTEETGLNAKAVYPLMNPNSPRYGRKINGWSCVRANESTETRDKLLAEQALRLEQDKLINDAKKS
jgi:hypothetical protein